MVQEIEGLSEEPASLPHPPSCLCCFHFAVDLETVYRDSPDLPVRGRRRRRQLALAGAPDVPFLT
jgi:hypothetical protein